MSNVSQWSTTAASNNAASPDGFAEGQAPSTVNDCSREVMAAVARWYGDTDGTLATAGGTTAYTLTTNSSNAALADQSFFIVRVNAANTGASTLAVDGLAAKSLRKHGAALASGDLVADTNILVTYNATDDAYDIIGGFDEQLTANYQPLDAGLTDVAGLAVTNGNFIVGDGANWVAESGNTARTSLGLGTGDSPTFTGITATGAAALQSGVTVTGNIVVTGTVDGRDVAADGTKLDGIEASAKDDQTITAGTGMTGGGSGNPTLNVIGGTGITANANDIEIDISGLTAMTIAPAGTDSFLYNDGGTMKQMSYNQAALPSNNDSGAHSFVSTDVGTIRYFTGTSATWTMNSGIGQDDCYIIVVNSGSGTLTLASGTATINSANSLLDIPAGGIACLIRESSTVWFAGGSLE